MPQQQADAAILTADHVTVTFGGRRALDDVSLSAVPGRVTGLIGPNGAGKSTLFDVVSGLRRPRTGRVTLDGHDITREGPARRARRGMSRTFQHLELFGRLTVRDNLLVAAELSRERRPELSPGHHPEPHPGHGPGLSPELRSERHLSRRHPARTVDHVLTRLNLTHLADAPADALPTGIARLVEVGRALVLHPRVLLLDEPAAGQDPEETERFSELLRSLARDDGTAVLLVEHDMNLVMTVCDDVYVLDLGRVVACGPPEAVQRDRTVLAAYLGES
ncbi:ABC transporter ATP-binding protein [Streptomyces sp. NPDC004539]|uniref:ABC transporter ATP-binding protein n=1 Tax=Streptomyces sp. NPDC004539 TaxID=3154280 RepID=UPI0033A4F664